MNPIQIPEALRDLNAVYSAAGHRLWLVGGFVRDHVRGIAPKDVDLATTATPDEQVIICNAAGIRWIGTGLQHGTLTVLAGGEPYEITTLRTDVETDGRHATVAYTRDLLTDLERRDLTMNALAIPLSNPDEIIDPFGGVEDALAGRVRFVGDAGRRIREDYLRILRWLRFKGRFQSDIDDGADDLEAIAENAQGLSMISVERVWSEISRILSGGRPAGIIDLMETTCVLRVLGLPSTSEQATSQIAKMRQHTNDPAALLAAWLGPIASDVANQWKMSNLERDTIRFVSTRMALPNYGLADAKFDLVDGYDRRLIEVVLKTRSNDKALRELALWEAPDFPVQGRDLVAAGMAPGKTVGETLKRMREAWIASDYALTREELMIEVGASS